MNIVKIDSTAGDIKLLALAIKTLIDLQPDKEAFNKLFSEYTKDPAKAGEYFADLGKTNFDRSAMIEFLKSSSQ